MPILTTIPTGARSHKLPTRRRMLLADDVTYQRFRRLAIAEEDAEKARTDNRKIRELLRQFADELR